MMYTQIWYTTVQKFGVSKIFILLFRKDIELIRSDIYKIYSIIEDRKHAKQKIEVKDLTALLKAPENLNVLLTLMLVNTK